MKYIQKEDYLAATGINLDIEFKNVATDNPSSAVNIFLQNQENMVLEYMQNFDVDLDKLDPEVMKKVMIYQVEWVLRNGDLSNDSDYLGMPISKKGYNLLRLNGYANLKTDGSRSYRERFN